MSGHILKDENKNHHSHESASTELKTACANTIREHQTRWLRHLERIKNNKCPWSQATHIFTAGDENARAAVNAATIHGAQVCTYAISLSLSALCFRHKRILFHCTNICAREFVCVCVQTTAQKVYKPITELHKTNVF